MAVSKKLLAFRRESDALFVVASILIVALSGVFFWVVYGSQLDDNSPALRGVNIALFDKDSVPVGSTASFDPALLSDAASALKIQKNTDEKYGMLTKPEIMSRQLVYQRLDQNKYTVLIEYDKKSSDRKMQRFFLWGVGGFLLFGSVLLITIMVVIRRCVTASIAELAQTTTQTENAGRAKSEFLACVSHELRTPLNAVIGYAEMLKEQMFGPLGHKKYNEYSENIHASGNHLLKMINDILDISHAESGVIALDKQAITVSILVNECIAALSVEAMQSEVEVKVVLQDDVGDIQADATKLKQAITNIISNAIKFTPAGGIIHVHVSKQQDILDIRVEDTGMGMSDTELEKATRGYFSQVDSGLDRKFEGMGLGLSFAKKLIEMHGGRLLVESVKNKGTTVAISVPCTYSPSPL